MRLDRREFLKTTGAGVLLAGVPAGWSGGAYAADGPETPKVRIGIIALTDCSSIVMAHELGLFKKYGVESTISKEASWAVIRDRLTLGENQATHMLLGMPYASTMGLLGSPVKPMIIPFYLNKNGQAITLTKVETLVVLMGVGSLPTIVARLVAAGRPASTPAAVISRGTTAGQQVVTGTLADIAERARHLSAPATIVIGEVVRLAEGDACGDSVAAVSRWAGYAGEA
jgi:hypothetical protein